MSTFVTSGHLGGYVLGGDDATWYPHLWRWFVKEHGVRSVLDVGCGEGHALNFFRDEGCDVTGVEGVPQDDPDIIEHDYTTGLFAMRVPVDLVWCCEFVEHVEEQYVPNFLASFACARMVAMTHAEPGQDGYHHVNCQPPEYWYEKLASIGFRPDFDLTLAARDEAAKNTNPYNHFKRSGLVFVR